MKQLSFEERVHPSSNLVNDGIILPSETRQVHVLPKIITCTCTMSRCYGFILDLVAVPGYLFILPPTS